MTMTMTITMITITMMTITMMTTKMKRCIFLFASSSFHFDSFHDLDLNLYLYLSFYLCLHVNNTCDVSVFFSSQLELDALALLLLEDEDDLVTAKVLFVPSLC